MSQFLLVKVAEGVARSTLRNVASTVRGVEDLGMLPPMVVSMHWRLSKGGQSLRAQPYFGPQSLGFLYGTAPDKEEHITVAPACLSYLLMLRVSKAASISPL